MEDPVINVNYCGIPGGRIYNVSHTNRFDGAVRTFQPDKILFQVGGNDIDSTNLSEEYKQKVVDKVVEVSRTYVHTFNVKHVVICQFLPRFDTRHFDITYYNERVILANRHLKEVVQSDLNIHYWKMKGLKDNDSFEDGVHLTDQAQNKYYRCIRGAMIHNFL